jgi:hypothetical protein
MGENRVRGPVSVADATPHLKTPAEVVEEPLALVLAREHEVHALRRNRKK